MSKTKLVVKDHGLDAFFKRASDIARLRSARVKVGVLSDTAKGGLHGVDPKTGKASPLTLAEIFAVLHFGTQDGHIPPRPVLTDTLDAKREELKELGAKLMAGVIFGEIDLDRALNLMGAFMSAEVKKAITEGVLPPNAPSTAFGKAMKGKTKKLFQAKIGSNKVSKRGKVSMSGLGDAFAAIGATASAEQGGYGLAARISRTGVKAAKTLGDAFAQIGALASVKPLIDTGRLLGAITWAIAKNGEK